MDITTPSSIEYDGCRLAYKVRGGGPPVVFIQGAGVHGDGWLPQVDGLSNRFRCLSFDNRGMGASQPVGRSITVEQMAADTCKLMDAQGWQSAHLVGHSLGGLVAQHIALSDRKRVRSLSLLCTFSRGSDATRMTWEMFWLGTRTYIGTRAMRRNAFLEMVMPPDFIAKENKTEWAERLAPIFGHDLADHPPVVMKQLGALRAYDATPHLSKLAGIPTLVVGATHDRIARVSGTKDLATNIPGAQYVEVAEAAHGVTIQCAERINRLLAEHLSKNEGPR